MATLGPVAAVILGAKHRGRCSSAAKRFVSLRVNAIPRSEPGAERWSLAMWCAEDVERALKGVTAVFIRRLAL